MISARGKKIYKDLLISAFVWFFIIFQGCEKIISLLHCFATVNFSGNSDLTFLFFVTLSTQYLEQRIPS